MQMISLINRTDYGILLWIQNCLRTADMTVFWKAVTMLGNAGLVWILLDLVLIARKKDRKTGILALVCLAAAALLGLLLKYVFVRPRPFMSYLQLQALISESGYSFPSGHTISSFANASAIAITSGKKKGIPAILLACLIAFSRLYLGVHYPSDVLGGILLGTAAAALVCHFGMKKLQIRKVRA